MSKTPSLGRFVQAAENRAALVAVQGLFDAMAAEKIDSSPGSPSPLYLHGPSGTGKSYLVQALVLDLQRQLPAMSASVVSARDLAPIGKDAAADPERYERLESADLAIVEDLQFLPLTVVEAVASLFDRRHGNGKPTLVTASTGPRHLCHRGKPFPARFTSRLSSGLVVALLPLQAPSRLRFLQNLAQQRQLVVPGDLLVWLAEHLTGGGRQMEGAIAQLETLAKLDGGLLNTTAVRKHFETQIDALRPSVERIAQHVGSYFQIAAKDLQSRRRFRSIVLPRQVSMYLARRLTSMSLQQIGDYFGGHDHSTVLHACQKIEQTLSDDAILSGAVHALQTQLT